MIAALAHIEAVLKAVNLKPVYDDDDLEQSPKSAIGKALVQVGDSSCTQEATHFSDSLECSIKIHHNEAKKALELVGKIRSDLTIRETDGVMCVIFEGVNAAENSYDEKIKSYKLNFKILTITVR